MINFYQKRHDISMLLSVPFALFIQRVQSFLRRNRFDLQFPVLVLHYLGVSLDQLLAGAD